MIKDIHEKTVYDFLHLWVSGHLKKDELVQFALEFLQQSPPEKKMRILDDYVNLEYVFGELAIDVESVWDKEFEAWEGGEIARQVFANTIVKTAQKRQHSKYFTIAETAKMLKKERRTIYNYIDKGKLKKEMVNGKPMITGDSVRSILGIDQTKKTD